MVDVKKGSRVEVAFVTRVYVKCGPGLDKVGKACRVSTKRNFCHLVTKSSRPKIMKPSTQKDCE